MSKVTQRVSTAPFRAWVERLLHDENATHRTVALSMGLHERQLFALCYERDSVHITTVDHCCVAHGGMHLDELYPYSDPMAQWPLIARLYRAGEVLLTIGAATGMNEAQVREAIGEMQRDGWRLPDKQTRKALLRRSKKGDDQ